MPENVEIYINIAAFIFTAIAIAGGVIWKLTRVEVALRKEITLSRNEIEARQDADTRAIGQTIGVVQEHIRLTDQKLSDKIREVELYCRDTFVRRDGFYKVRDDIMATFNTFGEKIEKRLERMEAKIDSKT